MTHQDIVPAPPSSGKQQAIQAWVERIRDEGLPAFTQTVQQIAEIASDDEADLEALSNLIKKDAGMTTKLLQASNTAYRTRRGRINTVSRALVMLGVDEVKKICLTCSLLDGLLEGDPNDNLIEEMTRAFHAATQSKLLAFSRGDPHTEEVFLSALMKGIGPLAFWRTAGEVAEKIKEGIETTGCTPEEAEEQILGFTLAELSDALAAEWKLDQFVPSENSKDANEKIRAIEIRLSSQLTRNLCLGWDSPNVQEIMTNIVEQLDIRDEELKSVVTSSIQETIETAHSFGVPLSEEVFPLPPEEYARTESLKRTMEELEDAAEEQEQGSEFSPLEPDMMFQLEVLRDLSAGMLERRDLTIIIVRILEGIYRGIGMDRVVFSLLTDKRDELSARIVFGVDQAHLRTKFLFPLDNGESPIFTTLVEGDQAVWRYNQPVDELGGLLDPQLIDVVGDGDFFMSPTVVDGKWLGVFYADRRKSGRELDEDSFAVFKQFTFQASLAFKLFRDD